MHGDDSYEKWGRLRHLGGPLTKYSPVSEYFVWTNVLIKPT